MDSPALSERQIAAINRMAVHLPKENDLTLLVLKGHLLMEERLLEMLKSKAQRPEVLEKLRWGTAHLICMAEAMYWEPQYAWVWHMASHLNRLRNQLAHKLEPKDLERLVNEFVKPLEERLPQAMVSFGNSIEGRLRSGICFLYGALLPP